MNLATDDNLAKLRHNAKYLNEKNKWTQEDLDYALWLNTLYPSRYENGLGSRAAAYILRPCVYYPTIGYDTYSLRRVPVDLTGLSFRGHDLKYSDFSRCSLRRSDMCDVANFNTYSSHSVDFHTAKINQFTLENLRREG